MTNEKEFHFFYDTLDHHPKVKNSKLISFILIYFTYFTYFTYLGHLFSKLFAYDYDEILSIVANCLVV